MSLRKCHLFDFHTDRIFQKNYAPWFLTAFVGPLLLLKFHIAVFSERSRRIEPLVLSMAGIRNNRPDLLLLSETDSSLYLVYANYTTIRFISFRPDAK